MNATISYRPFRSHRWFVPFAVTIEAICLIFIGNILPTVNSNVLFLTIISVLSSWCAKVLYDSSEIMVFLEQEGLRIAGGNHNNYCYVSWKNIEYAYYARSYKGHVFLVLSPELLDSKQVRQAINRSTILSKPNIDSMFIIHIDMLQNTIPVEDLINSKVCNILSL